VHHVGNFVWSMLTDTVLFWTSSRISFFNEAHFSRWFSIFRQRSKYPGVPHGLVGRDSLVSIVTRLRSRDQISNGERYSTPVQTDPGDHPASYTMGTRFFPGIKRPGHGTDYPPPSSAEINTLPTGRSFN